MRKSGTSLRSLRKDRKAVSPAISSVILTSSVVVLILITVVFASNFLEARLAENEFSAMEQFMQTVGLQIDDVAWTMGRTQTIRYASKYGHVAFESSALKYSVYVNISSSLVLLAEYTLGVLMFNIPVSKYTISNNYYRRVYPSTDSSFLQKGTSAPVSQVFIMEKLPMNDGNFVRVVIAPIVRMLNSTISTGGEVKNYYKFYLPVLSSGNHPRYSQSVTLMGKTVSVKTSGDVTAVRIDVSFPNAGLGFNEGFFNFDSIIEEIDVPSGSIIEFYTGEVIVSLGLHA